MSKRLFEYWFAVGEQDKPHSNIWMVIGPKGGKSDIYISHLQMSGSMKASLHEGGTWQVSFNQEFVNKQIASNNWPFNSRHLKRWKQSTPSESGIEFAYRVLIPSSELRSSSVYIPKDKPINWINPAPKGYAVEIAIAIAQPYIRIDSFGQIRGENVEKIFEIRLPNNGAVYIVRFNVNLGDWFANEVHTIQEKLSNTQGYRFNQYNDLSKIQTRLSAFYPWPDGSQGIVDIAGDTVLTEQVIKAIENNRKGGPSL